VLVKIADGFRLRFLMQSLHGLDRLRFLMQSLHGLDS
jgi:hypothetical protein